MVACLVNLMFDLNNYIWQVCIVDNSVILPVVKPVTFSTLLCYKLS